MAIERAFNAEAYHLDQAELLGYVSAEAYQYLFGEEIIKVVGKAAKAARGPQQSLPNTS